MSLQYYTGNPKNRKEKGHTELPVSKRAGQDDPKGYLANPELVDAVNVALILGQPLLLTGEPGTGKTQLAYSVAWELGFDEPLKFETKSTSTARDLFYTYDTVGRFHAAQTGEGSKNSLDYITYNALGMAILRANKENDVKQWLPKEFKLKGVQRSIVLIDEVDKAPRDFPNDILNEVEGMYFKVPELGNVTIEADKNFRPVLIITSNSEKHLPDAFLRRCIYYNIPFPDKDRIRNIVDARVGKNLGTNDETLSNALNFFYALRDPASGLRKKPATAELLGWLIALKEKNVENIHKDNTLKNIFSSTLTVLIKNTEDIKQANNVLNEWMSSKEK